MCIRKLSEGGEKSRVWGLPVVEVGFDAAPPGPEGDAAAHSPRPRDHSAHQAGAAVVCISIGCLSQRLCRVAMLVWKAAVAARDSKIISWVYRESIPSSVCVASSLHRALWGNWRRCAVSSNR